MVFVLYRKTRRNNMLYSHKNDSHDNENIVRTTRHLHAILWLLGLLGAVVWRITKHNATWLLLPKSVCTKKRRFLCSDRGTHWGSRLKIPEKNIWLCKSSYCSSPGDQLVGLLHGSVQWLSFHFCYSCKIVKKKIWGSGNFCFSTETGHLNPGFCGTFPRLKNHDLFYRKVL